jgi:hypothetical protein
MKGWSPASQPSHLSEGTIRTASQPGSRQVDRQAGKVGLRQTEAAQTSPVQYLFLWKELVFPNALEICETDSLERFPAEAYGQLEQTGRFIGSLWSLPSSIVA